MTTARSVSFTAARNMDRVAQDGVVTSILTVHVPIADRYVTGACVGGDAFIGRYLYASHPGAEHVVIVPADRSRVDPWWLKVEGTAVTVIEMPAGTTYADRNARLVAEGDTVFGFPAYPENDPRSRRSGTWQTIRMARKAGNFSQWHCVRPPYSGMIEQRPGILFGEGSKVVTTRARGTEMNEWERVLNQVTRAADKFDVGVAVHAADGTCRWTTQVLDVSASCAAEAAMRAGLRMAQDPNFTPGTDELRLQFITLVRPGEKRRRIDLNDRLLTSLGTPEMSTADLDAWNEQPS